MAKPGKKKKVLFVLEIIVLLLFIGGLYVYGQISSRLDKIEQPELKRKNSRKPGSTKDDRLQDLCAVWY